MDLRKYGAAPYAWAGIIAVAIMVVSVMICLMVDKGWDYEYGSLCDFGVSEIKWVSLLFIYACVISGILFIISGFGWYLFEESKFVRYGGLVIMLAGASLICVGLFDKTFSFHQAVAVIFAVIFIIAIALVSVQDILDRRLILVAGLAILGIFGIVTMFVSIMPYSMIQIVMMGYVFFWFSVKSMRLRYKGTVLE